MGMNPPDQPYGQQPQYPQQPAYGQPQYQQPAATGTATANRWGPTSLGMDANVASGLGYLIPIIGLVFFFIEKTNKYVKFNGAQSIMLVIAYFVVFAIQIVLGIIGAVADNAVNGTGIIFSLLGCLVFLLYFVVFALQIWGIIAGFTGKLVKFPIIGSFAANMAGGEPVPAY